MAAVLFLLLVSFQDSGSNWPSFRGPHACGVAEGFAAPVEWNVPAGKNVLWRTPVPGLAHSSPAVWGERVFVTSAVRAKGEAELSSLYGSPGYGAGESVEDEGEHAFEVFCLNKKTGELLWKRTAHTGVPRIKRHPKSTHANSTPACDEGHVVAFFGSEGLFCYDHAGNLLWQHDFGVLDASAPGAADLQWGFASSPVIHDGRVIVQCDIQKGSFLSALSLADGKELWRTPREESSTWCTPTVLEAAQDRKAQVLVNGYKHIGAYDLAAGTEIWKLVGGGDVPVPAPIVAHDLVFLTSAHGQFRPLRAVPVGAKGTLAVSDLAWNQPSGGIYMQTPLVYGEEIYVCNDGGVLACHDARTGEVIYRERLGDGTSGFSSSAVAAEGKIYFTSEEGQVHVVTAGPDFEVVAVNELGETCLATPALSEGVLFFRTRGHLVAIDEGAQEPAGKQ